MRKPTRLHTRLHHLIVLIYPRQVKWANEQRSGQCLYRNVVHVVRHPLRFLSSNFAFGQCVECWSLVESGTIPSIRGWTADIRQVIRQNRAELYQQTGGRTWTPEVVDTPA